RLPNEVLYKIFDLLEMDDLSRATAVNKRWHKVINPILWKSVIPDAALISCVPAFAMADRKYKTTHFHPKSHISPRFSFHKPQYGIAVRSLDLTHISFSVTDCYIRHIASYCPNLLYLNLSECHYLTDDSLFYISRCLPSLETLILQGCYLITDKGLSVLAANQKNLVTVNLGGCTGITENGVINLLTSTCTSSSSDNGKQKSSSIRRLWLNDCRFKKTRILLQQIGRTCNTRLEWLDIARCGHDGGKEGDTDYDYGNLLHHSDIEQLILACPNVTRLNLGMKPIKEESAITALMNAHEAEDHPFNELTHLLQRFNLEPSLSQTSQHTLRDHRLRMNARQIQLQQRDVISSDTVTFIITHLTKLERLDLSRWRCLSEKVMHTLS
ncbi:hypothetical protein BDF20DRAFT_808698, partial [Mycotypha africana]|uniref:uncharacterized protein n=1 Tax=Mycotypha africana TaxID=64632 RepID=UPI002301CECD